MEYQLTKDYDELREKMKKYDEAILKLIKYGYKDIIVRTVTDYLSLLE